MDLQAHRRRLKKSVDSDALLSDLYRHDISMYMEPPGINITLNEFQTIALERVQLLRIIEQAALKGHSLYTDDWKKCIKEDLIKAGLKTFLRLMSGSCTNTDADYQARKVDHISHYILRIAYCRSEDLRRWFINRELEWFRLRFSFQSHGSIKTFLQMHKFLYIPISQDQKMVMREELASTAGVTVLDTTEFYEVPFTEVYSLVKSRKVFVKMGIAYIPASELVVCIQSKFRASLSESLNVYFRRLPSFDDDRVEPLLANLHHVHTGSNHSYTASDNKQAVDPANLDLFSKKHFPLCMRHMHEVLRATHHHKHASRLTYGLFLKGIGLLYEDAVRFWREEFTKKIDSNKFEKDYLYNIKHMYGKVGKMQNYSPYSCIKIIQGSVGVGEHHGCPFRHWDPNVLKQKLGEHGVGSDGVNEIIKLAKDNHYQIACGKYFELTQGKPAAAINHPNQYFEESMNVKKESVENKAKQ